jgi:hypothetical protein
MNQFGLDKMDENDPLFHLRDADLEHLDNLARAGVRNNPTGVAAPVYSELRVLCMHIVCARIVLGEVFEKIGITDASLAPADGCVRQWYERAGWKFSQARGQDSVTTRVPLELEKPSRPPSGLIAHEPRPRKVGS